MQDFKYSIFTISNNINIYNKMKESFINAGFDDRNSNYFLLDNTIKNLYEPYNSINRAIRDSPLENIIIFCHHDILLDQNDGEIKLRKIINEMNQIEPNWLVLGNAGVNYSYKTIAKINDKYDTGKYSGILPNKVFSLDENILIINNNFKNDVCSTNLNGFHFYGTDICLNALKNNKNCFVIDFYLSHNGDGKMGSDFYEIKRNFIENWRHNFNFKILQTTTHSILILTKYDFLNYWVENGFLDKIFIFARKYLRLLGLLKFFIPFKS